MDLAVYCYKNDCQVSVSLTCLCRSSRCRDGDCPVIIRKSGTIAHCQFWTSLRYFLHARRCESADVLHCRRCYCLPSARSRLTNEPTLLTQSTHSDDVIRADNGLVHSVTISTCRPRTCSVYHDEEHRTVYCLQYSVTHAREALRGPKLSSSRQIPLQNTPTNKLS